MTATSQVGKVDLAQPFFARRERLDVYEELRIRSYSTAEMVVCQVRRDQPGLGLTLPHAYRETFLASIFVGDWRDGDIWCDGRHIRRTNTPDGGLGIYDLRHAWVADLPDPFAALHIYLPLRAINDFTEELHAPKIETLRCPVDAPPLDHVMLHLGLAMLPALERPNELNGLFAEYIFAAMRLHLVRTYGGATVPSQKARGGLAPWQERRARELILDDLRADRSLKEVASACGLSSRQFYRAFKVTTGLPPHRWLLRRRVDRAMELLAVTDDSLSEVAVTCGFADQSHFTRVFRSITGVSPRRWRRQRKA